MEMKTLPIIKNRMLLIYGLSLALLSFLLKWLESRFWILQFSFEVYAGAIAIIFTVLGIWLALKLMKPRIETRIIEREVYVHKPEFNPDQQQLEKFEISKRELEVLELIAQGLSNQEIAERLFVSLNTVKTHSSKLFEKLDVKRRTQAVEKAKRLSIIQ